MRSDQSVRDAAHRGRRESDRRAGGGYPRDAPGARPAADRSREAPDAPGTYPALGPDGRASQGGGDAGHPLGAGPALPRRARAGEGAVPSNLARAVALGDAVEERRAQDPSRVDDGVPRATDRARAEARPRRGAGSAGAERSGHGDARAAGGGAEVARGIARVGDERWAMGYARWAMGDAKRPREAIASRGRSLKAHRARLIA